MGSQPAAPAAAVPTVPARVDWTTLFPAKSTDDAS